MKKFVSIRQKFIVTVMVLMGVVFLVVLAVMVAVMLARKLFGSASRWAKSD